MFESLEKRFYPRDELAKIAGLDVHDHNFAGTMKKRLERWGYTAEHKRRRGFVITKVPETPEERLKEILVRFIGLDSQIKPIEFAYFITAFHIIDRFESMPWEKRETLYYEYFGIPVSHRTFQNWCKRLCEKGTMWISRRNSQSASLWHTYKKDGLKIQEPADPEGSAYKEYCARRSELLKDCENLGMSSREKWETTIRLLFNEYGVYYKCKCIDLPAFGPEVQEITDLTFEIMINT